MISFPDNVRLISTFRQIAGGRSKGGFDNFNLAHHVNDVESSVISNRSLLRSHFELPSKPKWLNQTHSNKCIDADEVESSFNADASYSKIKGTVCAVLTADCLPVFISNKEGTAVGIAHAGWRGLIDGVIDSLVSSFDCKGGNLVAHLGPAISQQSFEVGEEVKSQYLAKDPNFEHSFDYENGQHYLDLYHAATLILNHHGIDSVSGGGQCTFRDSNQYFSYRRDGYNSGRMAHLIWME